MRNCGVVNCASRAGVDGNWAIGSYPIIRPKARVSTLFLENARKHSRGKSTANPTVRPFVER